MVEERTTVRFSRAFSTLRATTASIKNATLPEMPRTNSVCQTEQRAKRRVVIVAFVAIALVGSAVWSSAARGAEPDKPAAEQKADQKPARRAPINWSLLEGNRSASYTHTSIFGLEAQGTKFVYVFDRSGSMSDYGGKPLRAAKAELLKSLNELDEHNQFYIIFYNEEPRLFNAAGTSGRLVFATPENKQAANDFVTGIKADGGTNHLSALLAAIRLRPDVIFLLTDGEDKDDLNAEELDRIDRLNGGGASINVIQFGSAPRPNSSLVQLAKGNRGQSVFVDPAKLADHAAAHDIKALPIPAP